MELLQNIFRDLSNKSDVYNYCKSGTINIKIAQFGCTVIHVCGKFYPWQTQPKFYACQFFNANCDFLTATSKTIIKEYNRKNQHKIMEFDSIENLNKFIISVS